MLGLLQAAGRTHQRELPLRGRRAAPPVRRRRPRRRAGAARVLGSPGPDRRRAAPPASGASSWASPTSGRWPLPRRRVDFGPRRSDDHYVIYTGGTTGLPKGVVWTQENAFYACIGGGDPSRQSGGVTEPGRAGRPHHGRAGDLPACRPAHARGRPVDVAVVAVLRRDGRAAARLARPGARVAHRGRGGREPHDRGRRPGRAASGRCLAQRRALRRVEPVLDRLGRRPAVARAPRAAHGDPARRGGVRRLRLVRDRGPGRPAPEPRPITRATYTAFTPYPVDHGDRRGRPDVRSSPVRAPSAGWR